LLRHAGQRKERWLSNLSDWLHTRLISARHGVRMNSPPTPLAIERPTVTDLQRAQLHALRRGDRRRAAAYALLVERRVTAAQRAAA
jgi:hypothetical protein